MIRTDPDFVGRALDHGHQIHPWTINRPDDIDMCLDLGVHAVTTNYPDIALDRLKMAVWAQPSHSGALRTNYLGHLKVVGDIDGASWCREMSRTKYWNVRLEK